MFGTSKNHLVLRDLRKNLNYAFLKNLALYRSLWPTINALWDNQGDFESKSTWPK
jgi:hypothetical protein